VARSDTKSGETSRCLHGVHVSDSYAHSPRRREPTPSKRRPRGRHPYQRLTAVSFRAKQPPGRYADGNGLYLVVDPSGAKRWIWRGVIHGKRSDLGLGSLKYVSLAQAREAAQKCRYEARKGDNPKTIAPKRNESSRPRAMAIEVHAEHSKNFRNPKHVAVWLHSLEKHVFPTIGDLSVTSITKTSGEIVKALNAIWLKRPETARLVK
jgi:Arm DNA-binding domain